MAIVISNNRILSNKMPSSIPHCIPKEIAIQSDSTTSTGLSEDSSANSQTVYEHDKRSKSNFNGGTISLSSEANSYDDLPEILPLDYRLGWCIDKNDNLRNYTSQSTSVFMNDLVSMEVDSFCVRPNEWEMESICGDSLDTEEDISSIPEWINSNEDFWKC